MSLAQDITRELRGVWRNGRGLVPCPCHDDTRPSLRITDADRGDVVVHCFTGCDWRDIKDALRARGLLPERRKPGMRERSARIIRGIERQAAMLDAERAWRDDLARDAAGWSTTCVHPDTGEISERVIPTPVLARLALFTGPDLGAAIDATARLHELPPAFVADAVALFSRGENVT